MSQESSRETNQAGSVPPAPVIADAPVVPGGPVVPGASVVPGATDPAARGGRDRVPPHTAITPPEGWQLLNLRELWQFRDLLYFLAWRDVKIRYKQTILGAGWAVLQPLMM